MVRNQMVMVCQRHSSSGLPHYLQESLASQGYEVAIADLKGLMLPRLWSALRAFHPHKRTWFERRAALSTYSPAAWRRNTKLNTRLVDGLLRPGGTLLQVGGLYFPHERYFDLEYFLFFTYTMKLAFRDGYSPWVPAEPLRPAFVEYETELYRRAKRIFVSAKFVKQHLVEEYAVPAERVSVVGMGVNEFFVQNTPDSDAARPLHRNLLFVGYTFELKGGPVVLEAFARAQREIPGLTLTIVGPRPTAAMRAPGVLALGEISDRAALLAQYRSADLFVLPSRCDSFGFVFLEAMTQGVPCIGADLNAMPDIIGDSGFLVKPGDAAGLADAIGRFYRNPEQGAELGRRARARVRERFTWGRVAESMKAEMSARN